MIRNEEQIQQLIKDTETIRLFLESLDTVKHRDLLYLLQGPNRRLDLIREVLADPIHNYGVKPVTAAFLQNKLIRPAGAYEDFMEFFTGEE